MPKPKQLTPPTVEQCLGVVEALADRLDDAEATVEEIRSARDVIIWTTKQLHGKNVTYGQLGRAAGLGDTMARKVVEQADAAMAKATAGQSVVTLDQLKDTTAGGAFDKALKVAGLDALPDPTAGTATEGEPAPPAE